MLVSTLSAVVALLVSGLPAVNVGDQKALAAESDKSGAPASAYLDTGSGELVFPVPDGFCLGRPSSGPVPHIAPGSPIYRCKGNVRPPGAALVILVSIKNPGQKIRTSRKDFIQSTLSELRSSAGHAQFQQGIHDGAQLRNADISASLHVDGADESAVYFHTFEQMRVGAQVIPAVTVSSATIANGYIVLIQYIARAGAANSEDALLVNAKAEAKSFVEHNS